MYWLASSPEKVACGGRTGFVSIVRVELIYVLFDFLARPRTKLRRGREEEKKRRRG